MTMHTDPLPEGGSVELIGVHASDLMVVRSARVSFGKTAETWGEAEDGLLGFLMRERHGTPFEHNYFAWHVRCPIFVAREWMRHRVGCSYNERSGRYSIMDTEGWVPALEDVREQIGKPGAYTFQPVNVNAAKWAQNEIEHAYRKSFEHYENLLRGGIAKEVARTVLPVGVFTEFVVSMNARSLMHFLSLRLDVNAQKEIRVYAQRLYNDLDEHMPRTRFHWDKNGRKAP